MKKIENSTEKTLSEIKADISKLSQIMIQGFESLNDKIDTVDENVSLRIDGLSRSIDNLAVDKVSRREYAELDRRVSTLELIAITKPKAKHKK